MNQMISERSVNINSKHIIQHIESTFIQLCQVLQIENKCSFDDAVNTCRVFLIKKHLELMEDSDKEHLINLGKRINDKIIKKIATQEEKDTIGLLKLIGII